MSMLSIVIIEYHCIDDVVNAVTSVKEHLKDIDWEAIVISNSEYDDKGIKAITQAVPDARVIINDFNSGYAGGVNRSLQEIDSPYVFLLNPDGLFIDNGMKVLLDEMESHPEIAAIGPKVVDEDNIVQPSCRRFPKPFTFLLVRSFFRHLPWASSERRRYLMEDFDRADKKEVDWVSGGAMLLRYDAIKQVGGMDERYFLYMEDVDWCRQMGEAGWKVMYDPRATVLHAGRHSSISSGLLSIMSQTTRWHLSSMWKFFRKWGFL